MVKRKMMDRLRGLKISLCQMKVTPGRPDINANYIIEEIGKAKKRKVDIIIFPEMCTTGYIVGDIFEDDFFIEDVLYWNRKIAESSTENLTVIFGSVTAEPAKTGEDGRQRKHNSAVIAKNGKVIAKISKTLQPNYRFFNDDKHFYSSRKIAQERSLPLSDVLSPVEIETRIGKLSLGVILCEDMWHENYPFNPTEILKEKGAGLIINISASPWTWQKNRKRHQIIRNLLSECKIPFVYVNNTGCQNTGKNIIVFDGSSAIYNDKGGVILKIPTYSQGTYDFEFDVNYLALKPEPKNDTEELYNAMVCVAKSIFSKDAKMLIGLSGGIDSAVVCAHLVDVLGKERVIAINMPMPSLNSQETQDLAKTIAQNLGIRYEVRPIDKIVEEICRATGVLPDTLTYENVQARVRKEILAAEAQKINGFFICCSNKVELAFGYGTLYGDIAGFYAPLGDLVKREVRQIADYLNKFRFKKEVIPKQCIERPATPELAKNQITPFDYGNLKCRRYHDEMVRAFTEFRKNPEWFLELYLKGKLEKELKLKPGTIKRLFPTANDFINDLERWWTKFQQSYFKRVQCPPIPIFSKRAFGRDLEESLMQTHFTRRYNYLKNYLLQKNTEKKIAIFGGSFNPPGNHHKLIIEELAKVFDLVLVAPCGIRIDKNSKFASARQRKEMTTLAFQNMDKVEFDFYDLDNNTFTPTYALQERYSQLFMGAGLWFAVGKDIVEGGSSENSEIHRIWKRGKEIWQSLNFAVTSPASSPVSAADLPPKNMIVEVDIVTRSTVIRERISRGEPIDGLVAPEVAKYIKEQKLYL